MHRRNRNSRIYRNITGCNNSTPSRKKCRKIFCGSTTNHETQCTRKCTNIFRKKVLSRTKNVRSRRSTQKRIGKMGEEKMTETLEYKLEGIVTITSGRLLIIDPSYLLGFDYDVLTKGNSHDIEWLKLMEEETHIII